MFLLKVLLVLAGLIILGIAGVSILEHIDSTPTYHESFRALEDKKKRELENAKKKEEEDHKRFLREISYCSIEHASLVFKDSEFAQYCLNTVSDCLGKALQTAKTDYLELVIDKAFLHLGGVEYYENTIYCAITYQDKGYENLKADRVLYFCVWLIAELKKKDPSLEIELDSDTGKTYMDSSFGSSFARGTYRIKTKYHVPIKTYKSW